VSDELSIILVIGKYKNHDCLKMSKPIKYLSNSTAWITLDIFMNYLMALDENMEAKNKKKYCSS
jgi:hypothetical protein